MIRCAVTSPRSLFDSRQGLCRCSWLVFIALVLSLPGLATCALAQASEALDPSSRVFVEVASDRDSYVVHQPIRVRVRIGVAEDFLSRNMIQLFRRELDVPVQVAAAWLRELEGLTRHASKHAALAGLRHQDAPHERRLVAHTVEQPHALAHGGI